MRSERSILSFDGETCDVVCQKCNWDTQGTIEFRPRSFYLVGPLERSIRQHHRETRWESSNYGHMWYNAFLSGGYTGLIQGRVLFVSFESLDINEVIE